MSEKKILGKKTTNLDNLDDKEIKQKIKDYLINYYKSRLKEMPAELALKKLEEKISKKLRLPFSFSFPVSGLAKALANFTVFFFAFLWFECFFSTYGDENWNPYDPIGNEDQYVNYLLYSWARGKPGYIYWLKAIM